MFGSYNDVEDKGVRQEYNTKKVYLIRNVWLVGRWKNSKWELKSWDFAFFFVVKEKFQKAKKKNFKNQNFGANTTRWKGLNIERVILFHCLGLNSVWYEELTSKKRETKKKRPVQKLQYTCLIKTSTTNSSQNMVYWI